MPLLKVIIGASVLAALFGLGFLLLLGDVSGTALVVRDGLMMFGALAAAVVVAVLLGPRVLASNKGQGDE